MKLKTLMLSVFLASTISLALAQEKINKTYEAVDKLKVETISGDIQIEKIEGSQIEVEVTHTYSNDCFQYKEDVQSNRIRLEEDFQGRNCKGRSNWIIRVPKSVELSIESVSGDINSDTAEGASEFQSVSGDVKITEGKGEIEAESVSGNIDISNFMGKLDLEVISGDIELKNILGSIQMESVSGDLDIYKAEGHIKAESVSGRISGVDVKIKSNSKLETISGKIGLSLSDSFKSNLVMESVSGSVRLDYNGNDIYGLIELSCRKNRGTISAPFDFDSEEEFEKNNRTYLRKTVQLKDSNNQIQLSTVSGNLIMQK